MRLAGWEIVFLAAVMGSGLLVLGYVEVRRLLYSAIDDRYGEWVRFWAQAGRLPDLGKRLKYKLQYALAFSFAHGIHDLTRLFTLVAFDLFVLFALLSPFWRYLAFEDWSPALAVAVAAAAVLVYMAWKIREGMRLCRVHVWSKDTWRCERCGEAHALAEQKKGAKSPGAMSGVPLWDRLSWHRFWERRLESLHQRLTGEQNPLPAG